MLKKALFYVTPLSILVATLAIMAILTSFSHKNTSLVKALFTVSEVVIAIPAIIIDIICRLAFKKQIQWIWLVESVLFLIFCFVFIKK